MIGRNAVASLLTAALACATGGCAASTTERGTGREPVGVTLADQIPIVLTLDRMDGTPVDLSHFRGRAVLAVAFLMDDLASEGQMRHLERLARETGDDLVVLAISGSREPYRTHRDMLQIFARVHELQHVQVLMADDAVREGVSPLGSIDAVPTLYLINRAGVISRRAIGYMDYPQLRELVAPALPPHH